MDLLRFAVTRDKWLSCGVWHGGSEPCGCQEGPCGRQVLACRGPDTKNVDKTRPAMNREREKEKEKRGIKSRVAREATSQARKRKDDLMAI